MNVHVEAFLLCVNPGTRVLNDADFMICIGQVVEWLLHRLIFGHAWRTIYSLYMSILSASFTCKMEPRKPIYWIILADQWFEHFLFPIYWEESSHLTNIFQRGGSTTNQIILGFDYKSLSIPGSKRYGLHCGVPGLAPTAAYTYIYIHIYIYGREINFVYGLYIIFIYIPNCDSQQRGEDTREHMNASMKIFESCGQSVPFHLQLFLRRSLQHRSNEMTRNASFACCQWIRGHHISQWMKDTVFHGRFMVN